MLEAKKKKMEEEDAVFEKRYAAEDVEFNMFDRTTPKPRVFRRHSIGSSERLYKRLCNVNEQLSNNCALKRTSSVPDDLSAFM